MKYNSYLFNKININYEKLLNYFIILYAFCLPISRAGTSLCIISLFIIWLMQANFNLKLNEIKNNNFIVAIFAFILYSFIAILWSSDKIFALEYVKKYYHFLIIPIIITSLRREYIDKVFSGFIFGMLISEITSYGIFFELWTKKGISPTDPSPFMDHSNYSTYLAFTIFILINKILYTQNMKWKIFYSIFFVFSTSNLFINGGRTGQFAFLLSLLIFGFFGFKNKIKATLIMIFLSSSIFFLAYFISPVFKDRFTYFVHDLNEMIHKKDFSNSFSTRIALWITGIEASKHSLIFGTGIGDEKINAKENILKYDFGEKYSNSSTEHYIDFHNAFVQYLVQLGLFGLIIFLSIFYFLIRLKINCKMYKNLLYLFIILYCNHSMLGLSFHINQSMVIFSLFASLFFVISKYEKLENQHKN